MGIQSFIIGCITIGFVIFYLPLAMIIFCGFLPFFVSSVVDDKPEQTLTYSVGITTMGGIVPYIFVLGKNHFTYNYAISIVTNQNFWLCILIAAGMGWVLTLVVHPIIKTILKYRIQFRIDRIAKKQKSMAETWKDLT
jgi:hypothetical protein